MSNELSFDVEFTRAQIEALLASNPSFVAISGKYTYKGGGAWAVDATGQGYKSDKVTPVGNAEAGCIKPCP